MLEDKDLVSIQEVRTKVEKAYAAWLKYRAYSQEQVDAIVERMAAAGRANAEKLARMAVEETGYGNVKDKIAKNLLNADLLPRKMRGMRTIGLLREIPEERVVVNVDQVGNVVSAGVLIALDKVVRERHIPSGGRLALIGGEASKWLYGAALMRL